LNNNEHNKVNYVLTYLLMRFTVTVHKTWNTGCSILSVVECATYQQVCCIWATITCAC